MLGGVPDLDFIGQSVYLFWRECGVERTFCVRVEVIADQRDLLGFGEHPVKLFADCRKICFFAMRHHQTFTQPSDWLADHHDFSYVAALVFTILTPRPSWRPRYGFAHFP